MNADGSIAVAPGTASGQYAYPYTLCEAALPSNCDSGTATVTVDAATLVATADEARTQGGAPVTLAVLGNDTYNGAAVAAGAASVREVGAGRFDPTFTATLAADVELAELQPVRS